MKPPPPGVKIETPVEEQLGAADAPAAPAAEDRRPLWQRLADQKSAEIAGAAAAPASPSQPPRLPRPPRPSGFGGPGDRGPRRDGGPRDRREPRRDAGPREPPPPQLPPGEPPPPAPEAPVADEGSFADMYADAAAAARPRRRFQPGEKVAGKILQIGQDMAFLELGSGLADGMIETIELQDDDGKLEFQAGDIIDGVVVKGGERGVVVSRGKAKVHSDRRAVIEAAQTGLPVEGVVTAANKGGIEVDVMGQRAFCPMSQIDIRFVGDPTTLVGQRFQFRVQKADERDIVLSRRALLEEERADQAEEDPRAARAGSGLRGHGHERPGLWRLHRHRRHRGAGPRLRAGLGPGVEALAHLLRQGDKVQVQRSQD